MDLLLDLYRAAAAGPGGTACCLQCQRRSSSAATERGRAQARTPLYIAAKMGNEETVRMLLDGGADVNILTPTWGMGSFGGNSVTSIAKTKAIAALLRDAEVSGKQDV